MHIPLCSEFRLFEHLFLANDSEQKLSWIKDTINGKSSPILNTNSRLQLHPLLGGYLFALGQSPQDLSTLTVLVHGTHPVLGTQVALPRLNDGFKAVQWHRWQVLQICMFWK